MAIEGPLRELGIHDVFQLLDLSRKTGTVFVTSELRDNEGKVAFMRGRVVSATIKSNPHRIGDLLLRSGKVTEGDIARARAAQTEHGDLRRIGEILVDIGALSQKELERQVRLQIEAVVFELMSWREGFFRFEEGAVLEQGPAMIQISTESLLMEGARRIDEWSRIADRVPNLAVVPQLTPMDSELGPQLDLLPSEWEVLTMIDGVQDLRGIATTLSRSEFDVAKVVYGLISTGTVELRASTPAGAIPARLPTPSLAMRSVNAAPAMGAPPAAAVVDDLERGYVAVAQGDFDTAVKAWAHFLQAHPKHDMADEVRSGLEASARLRRLLEARHGS